MANLLALLIFAVALAATLGALAWLAPRIRRRGIGGGLMGPIDEVYNPGAHRSRLEIQIQDQRMVPAPSPGDKWGRTRQETD